MIYKILRAIATAFCFCLVGYSAAAQVKAPVVLPANWFTLDPVTDGYYGISLDKAYEFLKGKKSKTVVIAIVDSGIDTTQVDFKGLIWTNPREKAGNNKDDDKNGYVDDTHGWNFIGGPGAKCDCRETSEEVREYERLKPQYQAVTDATATEKQEYVYWLHVKHLRDSTIDKAQMELKQLTPVMNAMIETSGIIKKSLKLQPAQTFSLADIQKWTPPSDTLKDVKYLWLSMFTSMGANTTSEKILKDYADYFAKLNNDVNPDLEVRKRTVGDDPNVRDGKAYGNNILKLDQSFHGTMVAGFIGSKRDNGYGINGVADNVRLMPIVASPDGDEYDKDVANAIYYAVNNGAKIINMSFGKKLSPHKDWVDGAFKYAAAHDVLLVTASGNDSQNLDDVQDFPNDTFLDGSSTDADNVINVGASGPKADKALAADFSNYGKKNVDVFAPGVKVTSVGFNKETETEDGTSFSSPITAGVAALVLEYYPDLSAKQLKQVILKSAKPLTGFMVNKPGSRQAVDFTTLSRSGGIVNAYEALKIASGMKGERK